MAKELSEEDFYKELESLVFRYHNKGVDPDKKEFLDETNKLLQKYGRAKITENELEEIAKNAVIEEIQSGTNERLTNEVLGILYFTK